MSQHQLFISKARYPGGLRIIECHACSYAMAAEINETGVVQYETAVSLDYGDFTATHALFQAPEAPPTLDFGGDVAE